MNAQRDLEPLLRAHFDAHADRSVLDGQLRVIAHRTAGSRQRPAWLAALRSPPMSTTAISRPAVPRVGWMLVALSALLILALAVALLVGGRLTKPAPFNGLISFGRMDGVQGDTV